MKLNMESAAIEMTWIFWNQFETKWMHKEQAGVSTEITRKRNEKNMNTHENNYIYTVA